MLIGSQFGKQQNLWRHRRDDLPIHRRRPAPGRGAHRNWSLRGRRVRGTRRRACSMCLRARFVPGQSQSQVGLDRRIQFRRPAKVDIPSAVRQFGAGERSLPALEMRWLLALPKAMQVKDVVGLQGRVRFELPKPIACGACRKGGNSRPDRWLRPDGPEPSAFSHGFPDRRVLQTAFCLQTSFIPHSDQMHKTSSTASSL